VSATSAIAKEPTPGASGIGGLGPRQKALLAVLKIAISFALFAYVVAKVSPGNVWATMRPADPRLLAAAAGLFLFSSLVGSWLWGRLLRAQGVPIPYRKVAAYYFVGLFFNNFLPSNVGGDIARISDASKYSDRVSPVFSATLMERLIGVVAIALLAVIASFEVLPRLHLTAIYVALVAIFLTSVAAFLSIFSRRVLTAFEWPFRAIGARRVADALGRLLDDMHGFRAQGGTLLAVFLASSVVQVSRIYVHYFVFVPVLAVLVSLPLSLNGLGVREGAAVVLFHMVGLTREQSFTIPFLTYVISVVISLLGGLIFLSRSPRRAIAQRLERRRAERAVGAGERRT
jgi:uncharacterized protein (TIRG00374 family)